MAICVYNSLTRKKETFVPLQPGQVRMYVCGPTVYDVSHIGHLRAAYVFDVIRRYLIAQGYSVVFVRNITDVDDKIIARAQQECARSGSGDLSQAVRRVAEEYAQAYRRDMERFGILPPDIEPKATEHIADMIAMIEVLLKKNAAYVANGDVYFRVRAFSGYGKLSGQSPEQMLAGARVEQDVSKEDPLDFALWKRAKPNEPWWESPWGRGRPGWHIECSAMNTKYLGETFDIHGGGRDLIFPHHENEVAQSEAATGKLFARYWLHNGLVTVNNEKMSKSLGNYVTIAEVLDKAAVDAVKILFLSCHYAHPVDFSEQRVREAETALERFMIFFRRAQEQEQAAPAAPVPGPVAARLEQYRAAFLAAMDDDFNSAQALAELFNLVSYGNQLFAPAGESPAAVSAVAQQLRALGGIFGLFMTRDAHASAALVAGLRALLPGDAEDSAAPEDIQALMDALIARRRQLRQTKQFAAADALRRDIQTLGIALEDRRDGTTSWRIFASRT
ncbi:MAG: cysteine--tRNA ligase [Candidatus Omnitrophica bacterium]|nr:cysteine--tRNA ligase [Candidatus Omnitrophota bacterium]